MAGAAAGEPFGWRGDGSGRFPQAAPPAEWNIDQGTGVCWKTVVGKGAGSPIVAGPRVFITAEPALLMCLDRSGKILWQRDNSLASLPPGTPPPVKRAAAHPDCGYATATPVTDGKYVYAGFGTGVVACYNLDGKRQWARLFDQQQESQYGRTASPLLVGDMLVATVSRLVALRPRTGETLWEAPDAKAAYGTPAPARIGGVDVLLTPHGECVRLSDGRVLAKKLCSLEYSSPVVHDGTVYCVGSESFALRLPPEIPTGAGPAAPLKFQRLWESDDVEGEFYGSPVYHDGIVYCLSNQGNLYALDAKSGALLYRQELDIPSASGKSGGPPANLYASLTLAGQNLLACNDAGDSLVIAPGKQYRKVARNFLDRGSGASPVADGRLLLVRGGTKLYGLGGSGK
jgi:outer membrane protein assembly factor BamB